MAVLFEKTKLLTDKQFHYCPGCNHGIIHRLVAEVIDEMQLDGKVIGVAPVGCSVFAYDYFNCDMYEAAHGRAPAVATGIKRAVGKDTMVFTYQGDGDLASIGTAGTSGAGMIMLAMVLQSVGLPVEGIALVAGVDRIFDMGRTTVNITGDAACTLAVSRMEERKEQRKRNRQKAESSPEEE